MRKILKLLPSLPVLAIGLGGFAALADGVDPYLWLETSKDPQALAWVATQNQKTLGSFEGDTRYADISKKVRTIVLAKDLPLPGVMGKYIYNFWQDGTAVHGLWRRTSMKEYAKAEPAWETVLDLDALSKQESKNWVWEGSSCLPPSYQRCLLTLSNGGSDAADIREFDVTSKSFVTDGFVVPSAKSDIAWLDLNHVYIGTDFGPGSMTNSSYPRISKLWTRGQPLASATTQFEGQSTDVDAHAVTLWRKKGTITLFGESKDFYSTDYYVKKSGANQKLPLPGDVNLIGLFKNQLLLQLRSDWTPGQTTFSAGSLVSVSIKELEAPKPVLVFAPDSTEAVSDIGITKGAVYVSLLKNVSGQLYRYELKNGAWKQEAVELPDAGAITLMPADSLRNGLLIEFQSFLLTPAVLAVKSASEKPVTLKKHNEDFDSSSYVVEQFESTSKDGTKIPYFAIHNKNMKLDGSNPTLQYGYGGFEDAETPFYMGSTGKVWLESGGVYVLANIRGGGEFGPKWHQAAVLTNRQRAYDDFISVSEDLISRKVTSPRHLGIEGGSNGGLLVGATFVERPDLYHAVVCQVPLLDMIRYPLLGAGASWEAEYGDPADPTMRAAILGYSPYQNVKAGVSYPEIFFETTTADDRVTPAHARKMTAKMEDQGHSVYFYENTQEGGHSTAANLEDTVHRLSLEFTYLFRELF